MKDIKTILELRLAKVNAAKNDFRKIAKDDVILGKFAEGSYKRCENESRWLEETIKYLADNEVAEDDDLK